MEPVAGSALAALAALAVAVVGYFGVRYTARASKVASEQSALMAAPQAIAAGYDMLNDDLWRSVTDLRARVASLEGDRAADHIRYRAAIAYIRRLLSLLTLHAPQVPLPQPPPELREDVRVERPGKQRKDQT
jgi:hypothetical protein